MLKLCWIIPCNIRSMISNLNNLYQTYRSNILHAYPNFLFNIYLDCVLISIKRYFVSLAQANHIGFWQGQHKNICICGKKERVYVGLTFNLIITNVQRINRVHERYTRKSHVKHYSKEIPFWWQNITVSKNAWQCQGL